MDEIISSRKRKALEKRIIEDKRKGDALFKIV